MNKKWYEEVFHIKLKRYDDVYTFIKSLNTDERRVVGYKVKFDALCDEITVTFANLK